MSCMYVYIYYIYINLNVETYSLPNNYNYALRKTIIILKSIQFEYAYHWNLFLIFIMCIIRCYIYFQNILHANKVIQNTTFILILQSQLFANVIKFFSIFAAITRSGSKSGQTLKAKSQEENSIRINRAI